MSPEVTGTALVLGAVLMSFVVLTSVGERRRGQGIALAVAAGLLFPLPWVVWYLVDRRRSRTAHPA